MIRKSTNDLTIRPKMSSSVVMSITVVGLFVFFACLYFAYNQGVKSGHSRFDSDQASLTQLREELAGLKVDADKAQENLIFAQRQQQIQSEAYKQMSQAYANSEQKNAVLGSRLDFYRSIISPEDGQSGPAIQGVRHEFVDGQLSFDVTLVQAINHSTQIRGNLVVTLFENDVATGRWPESSPRSVSYQYFQQISGTIGKNTLSNDAKLKVVFEVQGGEILERWYTIAPSDTTTTSATSSNES